MCYSISYMRYIIIIGHLQVKFFVTELDFTAHGPFSKILLHFFQIFCLSYDFNINLSHSFQVK